MTEPHSLHLLLLLGTAKRRRPGNEAMYGHFSYEDRLLEGVPRTPNITLTSAEAGYMHLRAYLCLMNFCND